jgi:acyl carrier protein
MNDDSTPTGVIDVLTQTLGIEDRRASFGPSSGLFGAVPELDSLALLELVEALEDRFGIVVEDEDFSEEVFETIGSLSAFVDAKRASVSS